MRFRLPFLPAFAFAIGLSACVPKIEAPEPSPGSANFARTVVLGGSELSGYQDGALYREGQQNSLGSLITAQLRLAGGGELKQNLMLDGVSMGLNKPWVSRFRTRSQLGDRTDCEGVVSMGPVSDTLSELSLATQGVWNIQANDYNDLAIPNAGLWELTTQGLGDQSGDGAEPFAGRYMYPHNGKSALDAALDHGPSFFILWPGMQDMLNWATQGGHGVSLPTPADFRQHLDSILQQFAHHNAKGCIATLPDIGQLPYFTTIPSRALELNQARADSLNDIYDLVGASVNFQAGENGFIVGDPNTASGFRQMQANEYITLSVPLDSMKCFYMGVLFTLMPDRYTLIESELDLLRDYVEQYNLAIVELTTQYGLALADMRSFYTGLQAGLRFDAVDFDTEFVSGGFFSLDGLFPHPKGTGMLANEFIAAINAKYGATIPPVQLHSLRGVLFP